METLQNNITIFSSNTGLFATFDVTVDQNDVKLTLHKDKSNRDICDLDLRSMVIFDEMNLNSWQRAELDRIWVTNNDSGTNHWRGTQG